MCKTVAQKQHSMSLQHGPSSSPAMSMHSSEAGDDFVEDTIVAGILMEEGRIRSKSTSDVNHTGRKDTRQTQRLVSDFAVKMPVTQSVNDSIAPLHRSQSVQADVSRSPCSSSSKHVYGRSISVGVGEQLQARPKLRIRSKSCLEATPPSSRRRRIKLAPRLRKISTNSISSFGKGYEGLLLSKPAVVLSPDVSLEHSPELTRKQIRDEARTTEAISHKGQVGEKLIDTEFKSHLDHGYAWMIVLAAGLAFFLGGGFGRCFPLIYQRLMVRFQSSATATAWVAALHGAVKLCSSPIVSALCNRFGIRAVVLAGGLVTATGLMLTAFTPSLAWLYLTYSTISAFGSNMVHAPSFLIIGEYFDKKKGTAMAIATTCLTLGGVLLAPLLQLFFSEYGFCGAMLLSAAIMLHYCVTGALYRPPTIHKSRDNRSTTHTSSKVVPRDSKSTHPYLEEMLRNSFNETRINVFNHHSHDYTAKSHIDSITPSPTQEEAGDSLIKKIHDGTSVVDSDVALGHVDSMVYGKTNLSDNVITTPIKQSTINSVHHSMESVTVHVEQHPPSHKGRRSCPHRVIRPIVGSFKLLSFHLGLHLLCEADCLAYGLLMGVTFWAFAITNTFLVGLAVEVAALQARDVAVILSVTSATDIASRILSGLVFDTKKLKSHRVGMLLWLSTLAGVSTALLPLATSYALFFIGVAICSGLKSAVHTQHVTVLSQLVGPKRLSSAMGLMRFFQGVGVMAGLATGGLLTDWLGTYTYAFMVSGALLVLATAIFSRRKQLCMPHLHSLLK